MKTNQPVLDLSFNHCLFIVFLLAHCGGIVPEYTGGQTGVQQRSPVHHSTMTVRPVLVCALSVWFPFHLDHRSISSCATFGQLKSTYIRNE